MLNATITVSNGNADWIQQFAWVDTGILAPTMQAGGVNFTSIPNIACSPPVDANGNLIPGGKPALITANGISGGSVTGLTLQDPGNGYVVGYPPTIEAVPTDGNGSGFAAFTTVGNPINLTGSVMTMEIRQTAASAQAFVTVGSASPNTGITITSPTLGQFQIVLPKAQLALLNPGTSYVHDLIRLRTDGYTEQMWTGTITVIGGVTR